MNVTDQRTHVFRIAVEVDESVWTSIYGDTLPEVRRSVESYVLATLSRSAAAYSGAIVNVTVSES